ncbi:MAG: MFS transporter, partial [Endomicrobium sp.]|nr:MFS transporter [Endomicrobium sp.]
KTGIFIESDENSSYSEFIFKNNNSITLASDDFSKCLKQKKESKASYRNSFAAPFIQLVIGFEFFAAFSTIYLQGAGYSLSSLGFFFAICSPLGVAGSLISPFLSKRFGQRNVIMANLLLHCVGDTLLLLAGISPLFLALGLGIPAMAAAGISSLLIPFLHTSLAKSGRADKFEAVYGKTRSIFWIGLAVSSVAGSWLAQFIGFSGVIAMSCVVITVLTIFSFISTSSIKEDLTGEKQPDSAPAKGKKFFEAFKEVFKIKDLKITVILNFLVDTGLFVFLALAVQTMLTDAGLGVGWLGVIMFAANLVQSLASKIVEKAASIVNNAFKRSVYFASLAVSAGAFMIFGNPVFLILFYILANFWQGAAVVIEASKAEKNVSQGIIAYWFSAKTALTTALSAGMQIFLCVLISNAALDAILLGITGIITLISVFFGFAAKDRKIKINHFSKKYKFDASHIRNILCAA